MHKPNLACLQISKESSDKKDAIIHMNSPSLVKKPDIMWSL